MVSKHAIAFPPISIIYSILNYKASMERGRAFYPFLNWNEDFDGAVKFSIAISFGSTLGFLFLVKLTQWLKGDKLAKAVNDGKVKQK